MESTLFKKISDEVSISPSKVTIVGVGQVGMACAYSILNQNLASEIVLCDIDEKKLKGELMDLQHGLIFLKDTKVSSSSDYVATAGSNVCIITAGARQKEGESRLDLVQRNTNIFKQIIPQLARYSPDSVLFVVSNPVDVLTYVTWKLSGFPSHRVIGSGTNLDSSRFRFLLSEKFNVAPTSVHGWIIGEHGDSSVPVWSGVNIAGVRLGDINGTTGGLESSQEWKSVHEKVVESAYEIIKLKGYTSLAIGLSVASVVAAFLGNTRHIYAVSVLAKGLHGIDKEVFISLPCVIGANGVTRVVDQPLTSVEKENLLKSVETIHSTQSSLSIL